MPTLGQVKDTKGALTLVGYPGDNMVLLAMSLDDNAVANLAGFSIWRKIGNDAEQPLLNRLNFDDEVHKDTTPDERKWTDSGLAPFQKFRWVDVPPDGFDQPITYRVQARYFVGQGKALKNGGPEAQIEVSPPGLAHSKFRIAFTRGYASSQAYTDKFGNKDIRPKGPKKADFDTAPFEAQYQWLGGDARKQFFKFIDECRQDANAKVDVFAYDLDEPDIIRAMCEFGGQGRLRAVLDDASLHTKDGAAEIQAAKLIRTAAGDENVKQGHFGRYQHNKVFIKRDKDGKAQKVLFGSMNFSLRGLYVQANNVLIVDDATTAGYFAAAFDNAFENDVGRAAFAKHPVAAAYNPVSNANTANLPLSSLALSPHSTSAISLGTVATAIQQAQSSVFFAVMEPKGTGPVLSALRTIAENPTIFSYGTVESDSGITVQRGDGAMGDLTPYAYLKSKVPWPFSEEWSGGAGKHIHHKFVVIDFNGDKPSVFTGSSNLAAGGEEQNGDSLIQIEDPVVAGIYGIEAVRLFDHYAFRRDMEKATKVRPLTLWYPGKEGMPAPWWKTSYDKTSIKFRDRLLFADMPLPPDLKSVKQVNWEDDGAGVVKKAGGKAKKASGKKTTANKKPAKKAAKKSGAKKKARKKAPAKRKKRS